VCSSRIAILHASDDDTHPDKRLSVPCFCAVASKRILVCLTLIGLVVSMNIESRMKPYIPS
jgi:hypothetical protein